MSAKRVRNSKIRIPNFLTPTFSTFFLSRVLQPFHFIFSRAAELRGGEKEEILSTDSFYLLNGLTPFPLPKLFHYAKYGQSGFSG